VFQVFAFDFIIDHNLDIWLVDIKVNPNYSLKNKELVESILDRQYLVLNHRSELTYNFFFEVKKQLEAHITTGAIELKTKEDFAEKMHAHMDFAGKRGTLKNSIMKSVPKTLPGDERRIWDDRQGELRGTKDPRDKLDAQSFSLLDVACVG
jgi:hypothetical protein